MEKRKDTGDLLEIIRKEKNCEKIQEKIRSEQITQSLRDHLNETASKKNAKLSDVLRRSGLKKAYFYSLFSGERANPSRDVLIQLGFGFEMTFEEVQEFLKHLGAAPLYPRIPRDGVLIFCFQRGLTITECDILLDENGETPLIKE